MTDNNSQAGTNSGSITMFTGKGGVGKTTCAAATALHHALKREPTLAISTDATPSLSHIFKLTATRSQLGSSIHYTSTSLAYRK